MDPMDRYQALVGEAEREPEYWAAVAEAQFTEAMAEELDRQGIARAELARRLGTSRAYVTQALAGDVNFSLGTMAKLAMAVGCCFDVTLRHLTEAHTWLDEPRMSLEIPWYRNVATPAAPSRADREPSGGGFAFLAEGVGEAETTGGNDAFTGVAA